MKRRIRTVVTPIVRALIQEEALKDRKARSSQVMARVRRQQKLERNSDPLPRDRAVQKIMQEARKKDVDPLDDPWSLGNQPKSFTSEDTAFLLDLARERWHLGRHFTVREAIWACRLRHIAQRLWPEWMPEAALAEAEVYARREAEWEAAHVQLFTMDLDAELAFTPWKSPRAKWLYEEAIKIGHFPRWIKSSTDREWGLEGVPSHQPGLSMRVIQSDWEVHDIVPFDEEWMNLGLSEEGKKVVDLMLWEEIGEPDWLELTREQRWERFKEILATVRKKEAEFDGKGGKQCKEA